MVLLRPMCTGRNLVSRDCLIVRPRCIDGAMDTRFAQKLIESLCRSLQPPKTRDKLFVGRADFVATASYQP